MMTSLAYDPECGSKLKTYTSNIKNKFALLQKKLKPGFWFVGQLTYLDFLAYEILDHNRLLFPTILNDYDGLKKFMHDFEELPPIADYLNSNRFKSHPLWSIRSFLGRC